MYFDKERADFLLEQLNIVERKNDLVKAFSSGMKQRLKFIFALIHEPKLLVLDEPTSNLDDEGKNKVYELIQEEANNNAVIIASNEKSDLSLCSETIEIEKFKNINE